MIKINSCYQVGNIIYKVDRISYINNKIYYYVTTPGTPWEQKKEYYEIMNYKKVCYLRYLLLKLKTKLCKTL